MKMAVFSAQGTLQIGVMKILNYFRGQYYVFKCSGGEVSLKEILFYYIVMQHNARSICMNGSTCMTQLKHTAPKIHRHKCNLIDVAVKNPCGQ